MKLHLWCDGDGWFCDKTLRHRQTRGFYMWFAIRMPQPHRFGREPYNMWQHIAHCVRKRMWRGMP